MAPRFWDAKRPLGEGLLAAAAPSLAQWERLCQEGKLPPGRRGRELWDAGRLPNAADSVLQL